MTQRRAAAVSDRLYSQTSGSSVSLARSQSNHRLKPHPPSNLNPVGKPSRQFPDRFKFKFLKFKCFDIQKTVTFYQTIGMSVEWKVELTAKDIVDETSMLTGDCDKTVFAISSSKPNKNTSDTSGTSSFISDTSKESTDHKTKGDKTGTDREYDPIQLIFEYTREISEPDFTTNIKKSTKISDAAGINSNENECRLEKKFSIDTKAVDDNFIMSSLENGSQVNKQKRSSIESEIQFPQLSENPDLDDPIAALLDSISKGYDEFKAKKHNYEYLVIYVHMIVRVVNRLKSKGFSIQMIPVPDVPEMKMAVSKDPNGVEIRFIEMSDVLLGESNLNAKKPWFSRPAYYTIPTNFAQDTVRRYERMFGTQTSVVHLRNRKQNIAMNKQLTNSNASLNMSSSTQVTTIDQMMAINSSISVATGFKLPQLATLVNSLIGTSDGDKKELALSVNKVSGVLKGFRLVDTEDIINGLSRTMFFWMGNELRNAGFSICLTQKTDAEAPAETPQLSRAQSLLLSVGFEVSNIDSAIVFLRNQNVECSDKFKMKEIGSFSHFQDHINNIQIELFHAHIHTDDLNTKTTKSKQKVFEQSKQRVQEEDNEAYRSVRDEEEWRRLREEAEFKIDVSYLRGHVRSKSEAAVIEVRLKTDGARMAIAKENKVIRAEYDRRFGARGRHSKGLKKGNIKWNEWNSESVNEDELNGIDSSIPDGIVKSEKEKSNSVW